MSIEVGSKYSEKTMQAVEKIETDEKEKKGKVAEVLDEGWQVEDKVIHKTKVVIYK